jgi:hypothetical protein
MYYVVSVDHKAWQCVSPEVTVKCFKGFKKCCVSSAVEGTDVDMLWNGSEEDGNVRSG